jgi:hypothetical protein
MSGSEFWDAVEMVLRPKGAAGCHLGTETWYIIQGVPSLLLTTFIFTDINSINVSFFKVPLIKNKLSQRTLKSVLKVALIADVSISNILFFFFAPLLRHGIMMAAI